MGCLKIETVYIPFDTITVYLTDTMIRPVYVEKIKEIPACYYILDTIFFTEKVDTAKIISEFFTRNYYDQVLVNDSTGYIRLRQTTEMNRIVVQDLTYKPPAKEIVYVTQGLKDRRFLETRFTAGAEYMFESGRSDMFMKCGVIWKDKYHASIGYSIDNKKSLGISVVFK